MKYTALTIGPIYNTINRARKTRELWGASYLFSRVIMQRIIEKLNQSGNGNQIILPQITPPGQKSKTGLYPDRLYMEGDQKGSLEKIIDKIKGELETEFKNAGCSNARNFIDNYFYFNIVVTDVDGTDELMDTLFKYIAQTELHLPALPEDDLCIEKLLLNIYQTNFFEETFCKGYSYPSLIEIATRKMVENGISENDFKKLEEAGKKIKEERKKKQGKITNKQDYDEDEIKEDDIIIGISNDDKLKEHFKQPHKYIAIVQSDGDNVGTLLGEILKLNNKNLIKKFSNALAEFAKEAAISVEYYGGEAVYAGGDDLLFFAPVLTYNGNIFSLIDNIDDIFRKKVLENSTLKGIIEQMSKDNNDEDKKQQEKIIPKPSMSYGLAITYYKFPLNEAREMAYEMLRKAKEAGKNRIGYHWQKHSGHHFTDIIEKDVCTNDNKKNNEQKNNQSGNNKPQKTLSFYCLFLDVLKKVNTNNAGNIFSSFIHNLEQHRAIIRPIINDDNKLENYFINFYDESIHKTNEAKKIKNDIKNLLLKAYATSGNEPDKAITAVYNVLRFAKFLTQKTKDND